MSVYKYKPILLYYATFHQDIETVKLLVENGVDVSDIFVPDEYFLGCPEENYQKCFPYYAPMPALQAAFYNGNKEIIKILIEAGADVNWENDEYYGIVPVLYTACRVFDDTEILKLLIEAGAKPDYSCLKVAIENKNIETVKFLIKYGLNVNYQNEFIKTALNLASQTTNDITKITKITDILLENTVDDNCNSFLHIAVDEKNIEVVKILIEVGADVNLKNKYGKTPLNNAMYYYELNIQKHNTYGYSEKKIWEEIIKLLKGEL